MHTEESVRPHTPRLLHFALVAAFVAGPAIAPAQSAAPVVDLLPASARSTSTFGSILNLFELPNGTVAVNDATSRQLVYLDRNLAAPRIVLDSTTAAGSYGPGSRSMVTCNCDELWYPDFVSKSILTYDANGAQKRVMAAPNASHFNLMMRARTIADTIGHLYYKGSAPSAPNPFRPPVATEVKGPSPDSTPLLRADFETRKVDTIGYIRTLRPWTLYSGPRLADGKPGPSRIVVDILASIDEWVALPDGNVAVVRGGDYHIDWVQLDGKVQASPKLPFDFKRLTDADKAALMDSARKAELTKSRREYDERRAKGPNETFTVSAAASGSPTGVLEAPRTITIPIGEYVEPVVEDVPFDRIPDYYPPIRTGAVTADLEGNVWILPTTSAQSRAGELVYDVVNRTRGHIARVRVPVGRSIAGFGKNGTVYLMSRDANDRWTVERSALPPKK